jgi:hypothetical protein
VLSLSDIVNVKVGIGRGVFEAPGATVIGGKKPSFNLEILKLFANGEQGFFYDPNDLSTMYQDAARTIPVTAAGQPVGLMKDKSGRNNHAFQTTSASRPILRQNAETGANYLEFDGVDDNLMLGPITLPIPFSHVTAIEDRKLNGTQALFSGGASGYLTFTSGTNLGIQQNSGNPAMYIQRGKKEVITHIANSAEVALKSNLSAATRSDIVHTDPYAGNNKKYIGAFNDTQFSTAARVDYYGGVFITEPINSAAEEEIRAQFNKRIGV